MKIYMKDQCGSTRFSDAHLMNRWAGRVLRGLLTATCVSIIAIGTPNCARAESSSLRNQDVSRSAYVMGVDDVLEIVVQNYETLNSKVTIRPDGNISMPRIGDIRAAGLSAVPLAAKIEAELKKSGLRRPHVTVTIKEVHSQRARILGAVKAAGAYDVKPGWHVMDLIAAAGGLSVKPSRITGRVVRGGQVIDFNVEQAVLNPDGKANIELQTNDLVYLQEQYIERLIHVVGEVEKPGAFDLDENLTVVGLLAQSGGATPEAALRKAHVLRGSEQIPLDLQSVLVDGQDNTTVTNFKFQSGDILVVPKNTERYGVMGEVIKPSYYPMPDRASDATVVKVLASAGGPNPDGDTRAATITRMVDGEVTIIPVNIDAILKGEAPDNIVLHPDDILNIPEARDQVHVLGEVAKPGVYKLKDNTGPLTLISEAGSTKEDAALQKAYVLRNETQIPLDLNAVLVEGHADPSVTGFKMLAGDILVIPENQLRFGVMGQVTKPGYFPYPTKKEDATVLNALAAAGGPIPPGYAGGQGGDLRNAAIIRMENGKPSKIPVNIEEILGKSGAPVDVAMRPSDILYVPPKKKKFDWKSILGPLTILSGRLF